MYFYYLIGWAIISIIEKFNNILEPTSGLDSYTAFILIKIMSNLAKKGKNIIFTIHSPNSDIFQKFDRLMCLKNGLNVYQVLLYY